ncbi:hypothetical protein NA57DRAFT_78537 [Rhizodiscina lignyota]|uniref:Uncharacterized protein n=1 Tax=Rhizodiscina lignyota TaxID=1504668 RepID=A0A9P4IBF0_9PEZI|nr:hypothetical protein NA57DRAFT_78537 [Rhizodiscina lignyota]
MASVGRRANAPNLDIRCSAPKLHYYYDLINHHRALSSTSSSEAQTMSMKFIDQTIAFPPCPEPARPAARRSTSGDTNFLFVNSKKGQIPKQSRQPMRSHVMQHARSQRKWSTSKGVVNWTNDSSRCSSEEADHFEAGGEASIIALTDGHKRPATKRRATEGMIYRSQLQSQGSRSSGCFDPQCKGPHNSADPCIGCKIRRGSDIIPFVNSDWALDPYCALPVRLDPASRWMLDQYLLSLSQSVGIDGRSNTAISQAWFAAAFASRAFMYSVLCAAATHLYALGQTSYWAILQYKSHAMTELNSTLADPVLGVTDGNIGAVFNLLCVDETFPLPNVEKNPSPPESEGSQRLVHLEGLKRMVQLRGGLTSLRTNPCLYSFLLWHSTAHTVASFQASDFALDNSEYDRIIRDFYQSDRCYLGQNRILNLLRSSKLPQTIISATEHVIDFSHQVAAWLRIEPKAPDFMHLGNFSSLIVQNLVRFLNSQREFEPMAEAVAVALVMFTVRATNDPTRPLDALHFAATNWLRCALRATDKAKVEWDPDLRLWVCTVGGICAEGSRQQDEIERKFVKACGEWGIESADQLVEALQSLLWVKERFDKRAMDVWQRTRRKAER